MPSRSPESTIIFPMVVDSPPGTMMPASPSNPSAVLTSTGSTPSRCRISACSCTSPCSARMPTFGLSPLPATRREPPPFGKVAHPPADHSLAESPARLGHGLRILEVRSRLHDCPRPQGGVAALDDPASHEHPV